MLYQPGQPVSVVLMCKNKANELGLVLDAVARNTERPALVVLSDDASTDGSAELFAERCRAHGLESRVVPHANDGSVFRLNTLRNDGVAACPDGLVVLLDADLVPSRTCFEAHRRLHLTHRRFIASTGPRLEYAFPDATGPINFLWGFEFIGHVSTPPTNGNPSFPCWQTMPGSMMAMTRQAIAEVGWFDTQYDGNYGYDDADFMIRAERKGCEFVGDWEAHVIHIPHAPSLGHRDKRPNQGKFIAKYGFDVVYPEVLVRDVRKPWHEHYQDILHHVGTRPMIRTLELNQVSAGFLAKTLARRVLGRLRGAR